MQFEIGLGAENVCLLALWACAAFGTSAEPRFQLTCGFMTFWPSCTFRAVLILALMLPCAQQGVNSKSGAELRSVQ